jgi:hypothetical protein
MCESYFLASPWLYRDAEPGWKSRLEAGVLA